MTRSLSEPGNPQNGAEILAARDHLRPFLAEGPVVGIVLGSGLGAFADHLDAPTSLLMSEIPGFPVPAVAGHSGKVVLGRLGSVGVACLAGRAHAYEGHPMERVVFGVRVLAALGCGAVLLTNAAGGIRSDLSPGDLMLISDHLNLTGRNPLVGPAPSSGPRFPDMSAAYDPRWAELAREAATQLNLDLKEGVYAGVLGPNYETPAEIRMLRGMGADAVGMSTVLEVIALRQLGIRVSALSTITNLAAGISEHPLSHAEVEATAARVRPRFVEFLRRWATLTGLELSR
ncbi:MAG TPA: purine-nucleoside phosphorylase [Polyangiaceae bacterium]|nr:purine-nucleoside phosphorylase [Polyangiaceae bacterium]